NFWSFTPRRDTRPSLFSNQPRFQRSGNFRSFPDFHDYAGSFNTFGEYGFGLSEKKSPWFQDEKQTYTSKLPPVSSMFWRDSKAESP
ncbi:hypothetical protein OESDEN_22712, partial [Oesophagostomum dentatum]